MFSLKVLAPCLPECTFVHTLQMSYSTIIVLLQCMQLSVSRVITHALRKKFFLCHELVVFAEYSFNQLSNFIPNIFYSPQVKKRVK